MYMILSIAMILCFSGTHISWTAVLLRFLKSVHLLVKLLETLTQLSHLKYG